MKARVVIPGSDHNKRMLKIEDLCTYTSMGTSTARKWAKSIGAEKHIGRSVIYDKEIIDGALDSLPD